MSAGAQIDYAALAKQAGAISSQPPGGGVDYAALAKQAGAVSSQAPAYPEGSYQSRKGGPILNANDTALHAGVTGAENAIGITKDPTGIWDALTQAGGSLKKFAGQSWDEIKQATGEQNSVPGIGTPFSDLLVLPHMAAKGFEGLASGAENSASDIETGVKNRDPRSVAYGIGNILGMKGQVEAGDLAGDVANKLAPGAANVLDKSAQKNYEDVLNPTKVTTKYQTQKIMPKLLDERPVAITRQGLADKAAAQADAAGQQIEQQVSGLQGSMKTQPVIDGLENLRKSYEVNGVNLRPEVGSAIDMLQDQLREMSQPGEVPGGAAGPGEANISYQDVVKARRILDDAVAEVGGYQGKPLSDTSLANIRKATANSFREELGNASPDLAAVNAKFHFWNTLNDVLEQTLQRKTGQVNALPKMETVIAGAGGLAKSGLTGGVGYAAVANALGKVIRSAGWRTVSAATKASIADSLASRDYGSVLKTLNKIGAGAMQTNRDIFDDDTLAQWNQDHAKL